MASSKFVVDVGARALRAKLRHDDFNGPFSRTDHHSAEADFLQKCSKEILQARIVVFMKATSAAGNWRAKKRSFAAAFNSLIL
jgi:hypothetical protein